MADKGLRYIVNPRWRFHYPDLYVTRVRLSDGRGAHVDLWDAGLASKVAKALETHETTGEPGRLVNYQAVPWLRGKALIQKHQSAAGSDTVGIANDRDLAANVVGVLNRLDPGRISPAKRIRIYWF